MKVFVAEAQGIYPQGIIGVFSTFEKAVKAIKRAKRSERDDYHSYVVHEIHVDDFNSMQWSAQRIVFKGTLSSGRKGAWEPWEE